MISRGKKICWIIIFIFIITVILLYKYIYDKYNDNDPILIKIKRRILPIEPRIADVELYTSPTESYTEDKKRIYLCLKDQNGKYYDMNTIMGVVLHELSHLFSPVIDPNHNTSEFNELHSHYIKLAIKYGIYDPNIPFPNTYCNLKKN